MSHLQGSICVAGVGGGWEGDTVLKALGGPSGEAGKRPQVPVFRKLLSKASGIFTSRVVLSSLGDGWRE